MRPTVFAPSTRRAHARLTTAIALACPARGAAQDATPRAEHETARRDGATPDFRIVHLATAHGPARVRRHRASTYCSTYSSTYSSTHGNLGNTGSTLASRS
ncbi:MAG: hypothetical protein ACXWZ4_06495 [Gemmatirosa sp.]